MEFFFQYEKWFFFSKGQGFLKLLFLNEIHQKKRQVPFSIFCGKLWQNSSGLKFDVYACLDCNCWKSQCSALLWHFRNKMPRPNCEQSLKFSWCIWNGLYWPQNARKENLQVININKQRFAMRYFSDFYLSNERANKEFRPYFFFA